MDLQEQTQRMSIMGVLKDPKIDQLINESSMVTKNS